MANPAKLVLIDGHALVYRAYFALPTDMATSSGELTNAVFGFASMLLNVFRDEQPEYLAVTFDRGLTGRDVAYSEYKATRASMPSDLHIQMERIRELMHEPVLLDGRLLYEPADMRRLGFRYYVVGRP